MRAGESRFPSIGTFQHVLDLLRGVEFGLHSMRGAAGCSVRLTSYSIA